MGYLCIIFVVLLGLIIIGHLLWLALAGLFRLLFGTSETEQRSQPWQVCPRCQGSVPPGWHHCHQCGLSRAAANQIRDLNATLRQLRRFVEAGILDEATEERLRQECQQTRQSLLELEGAEASPQVLPVEPWRLLERLLTHCADVRLLSSDRRRQVLTWYHQTQPQDLETLSPKSQLRLAQLLRLERQTAPALRMYRRLLESHPEVESAAAIAQEAAEFAVQESRPEPARWFLQRAGQGSLSPTFQQRLEDLERPLQPEEKIPEVREAIPPSLPSREPAAVLEPPPAPEPVRPRRSFGELLTAFMEEKNILWGELVGGLLIVGCSIALVISLWKTLEEIPYFPFLIFAGITAALFGIGLYTLHHWKLESSSRGLLAIALLLVPLDFLVLAGLSLGTPGGPGELATHAVSLGLFAVLVSLAGQVLLPGHRWLLTVALLGPCGGQLLVKPLLVGEPPPLGSLVLLVVIPLACYLATCGILLVQSERRLLGHDLLPRDLLGFLGLAAFALTTALAFLGHQASRLPLDLAFLAIPTAFAALPLLGFGLRIFRGSVWALSEPPREVSEGLSPLWRTAGSAVALGGMALLLGAAGLAWPGPLNLLTLGLLDFVVLTVIALVYRLPLAHPLALVCLAAAYLIGYHLAAGNLGETLVVLSSQPAFLPQSGSALLVLVVLVAGLSEVFVRCRRPLDALFYAATAGSLAVASLVLVHLGGLDEAGRTALTCAICAVAALALNARWRQIGISYGGLALLLLATLWGLQTLWPGPQPIWVLVFALESLGLAGLAGWKVLGQIVPVTVRRDLAVAAALLALALAFLTPAFLSSQLHPFWTAAVLGVSCCLLAYHYRFSPLTWLGSLFLLLSLFLVLEVANGALQVVGGQITFFRHVPPLTHHPFLIGFLGHATVALALSFFLRRTAPTFRHLLARPFRWSGLFSTWIAVLLLLLAFDLPETGTLAWLGCWLAVLWFLGAWFYRQPILVSAGQAALAVAVVFAVTSWLGEPWWAKAGPAIARSLQVYGIGLAALSLVWTGVRVGLSWNGRACRLLNPPWPGVDRLLLGAVVLGQCAIAIAGVWPGVLGEWTPAARYGTNIWLEGYLGVSLFGWPLLGMVVLGLLALPRDWSTGATVGLILTAVTVPLLMAEMFAPEYATASALRWGLSLCFLIISLPLWVTGGQPDLTRLSPLTPRLSLARRLLVGVTVVPVLVLSVVVAVIGFSGQPTRGPASDSVFAHIGWIASNVVPLVVVSVGLLGHGIRERLPGYTFAAGLVATISLMTGYALAVVLIPRVLDTVDWVRLVQLGTLGAALWALAWFFGRRLWTTWHEGPDAPLARNLLTVQVGLAVLGAALLLIPAVAWLTFPLPEPGTTGIPYAVSSPWTREVGSGLGWLALRWPTSPGGGVGADLQVCPVFMGRPGGPPPRGWASWSSSLCWPAVSNLWGPPGMVTGSSCSAGPAPPWAGLWPWRSPAYHPSAAGPASSWA